MVLLLDKSDEGSKRAFWDYFKQLKDKTYLVEIKQYRDNRSNKQLRYYWGVVVKMIADETGNEPEDIHEVLKNMFVPERILEINKVGSDHELFDENTGEVFEMTEKMKAIKTTSKLGTDEFQIYLEDCRRWAATFLNCAIPDPSGIYLQL